MYKQRLLEWLAEGYDLLAKRDDINFDLGNDPDVAADIEKLRVALDDFAERYRLLE